MSANPEPPESFKRLSDFARKIMAVPKGEVDGLIARDKKERSRKKKSRQASAMRSESM
jgi:hypothetical protein